MTNEVQKILKHIDLINQITDQEWKDTLAERIDKRA